MARWKKALVMGGIGIASAAAFGSSAQAATFPNFSDCPTSNRNVGLCVNIQSRGGFLRIKDFSVPIRDSLEIRGGVTTFDTGNTFIAPRGTTGFFARPVQVPGGLIGIDFPIPGNSVTATATLAGSPSAIRLDLGTLAMAVPVKLVLSNPLLGLACRIGTDSSPVRLNFTVGTTNPPAPNRPITGTPGTFVPTADGAIFQGNTHVDNSFAVPSASYCGLGLGLINTLVNAKLKLPSSAGNNEMQVVNDLGLKFVPTS